VSATVIAFDTNELARRRLLSIRKEPLFYANWDDAVFVHYETEPQILQRSVPYDLDLFGGGAFVSLVAFTMRGMRPRIGGRIGRMIFKPIATHHFLNIRTYVHHRGEPGIYFMSEWLSNRVSVLLGPSTFGLPYRFAQITHSGSRGDVRAKEGALSYRANLANRRFEICEPGSLAEFLLERYTAFTQFGKRKRFFRIWHEPWRQARAKIDIIENDLLRATGDWFTHAQIVSANYSLGVKVWMGWPHKIDYQIA
jgi:uncharacterized protein